MNVTGFDHIVLCVGDLSASVEFYTKNLGMEAREDSPGKWSLHFGSNKISLQDAANAPVMAKGTLRGSGNFCLVTEQSIDDVVSHLASHNIEIIEGPARKTGAVGQLMSVYFRDPDGNLVEVSNRLS